ncbi:aminotransferase class I/II-fold pyridoxal phosphate-dependent enzyme [Pseudomonas typographi]|uniref:Aminotransferase n=1 Tax=Pseudomonas typographi TaxID=2715964 RepID=A0ABR7Z5C4_9PSED|nr:aminotransferase class I/II-fold pyridoxal phosphate-dependent enzyme [Pseudomonas typographi]MBD1553049.1 aminotransferase class I/II-fold pyridoxal phosphate-dependent enzyme [Pseudomonas typographi]MBD1588424.1 aminotransferase class I/II-fold pyridoxal phosphate-dependent enzyme [Pseudomonas typographi]MBD1600501.1 aminotransferase class I/II-fold pyridoxal phosphate-dependent enzyme [Pseudomonas typographi]
MTSHMLSDRVQRIKPSPSTIAGDRAKALKREGKSIANLVVGEPDFDTPAHIREAAHRAIDNGETRYTAGPGTPELRSAISDKLLRENHLEYPIDQITVTNGAKSAVFLAFGAILNPEDEVIIPAPHWVSYPDMAQTFEGVPVVVPCTEDSGFKITASQLEKAITSRTKCLVINSPCNPCGATYTTDDYRELAKVLLGHPRVFILMDDIYEHIRYDDGDIAHLAAVEPALKERVILINGVSKTYAMTGWRIGYLAGSTALVKAVNTLKSQSAGTSCSISQAAALAAYTGPQGFIAETRAIYKARRDEVVTLINAIPGLNCKPPAGAFYVYIRCSGLIGKRRPDNGRLIEDDNDVVMYFLEQAGVALMAGVAYGLSPYFRMSIATSIEVLRDGCARIAKAVEQLAG